MTSIVFVIYSKKCPVLQLLCQAIPFPSNFKKNFFQLLFLFILLTALFFSVTIAVKVNLYYSVAITVTVNWRNTGVDIPRNAQNVRNATDVDDATAASIVAFWPLRHLRSLRSLRSFFAFAAYVNGVRGQRKLFSGKLFFFVNRVLSVYLHSVAMA